jgi:hypothetical protein
MQDALKEFATALQKKASAPVAGEPEDQLRAPFEQLVAAVGTAIGIDVLAIGETRLDDGVGKPDFGISANRLLCGYAEA